MSWLPGVVVCHWLVAGRWLAVLQ